MARPIPDGTVRANNARNYKARQADFQHEQTISDLGAGPNRFGEANGDEQADSTSYSSNFAKGLPHDSLGNVSREDYATLVAAINADPASNPNPSQPFPFDVPLGPQGGDVAGQKVNRGSKNNNAKTNFHINTLLSAGKSFSNYPVDFNNDVVKVRARGWESPRAGHAYDLQGADSGAVGMAPAPALGSDELIAEMGEVYALALLRDVGFSSIKEGSLASTRFSFKVQDVLTALLKLPYFKAAAGNASAAARRLRGRQNQTGQITGDELFRGSSDSGKVGPQVSQFLLMGSDDKGTKDKNERKDGIITYGSQSIDQRVSYYKVGADYMTRWSSWLDVQNGANFKGFGAMSEANNKRFICCPRDLAAYVHDDQLYQAYLNATLLLLSENHEFDRGLPEGGEDIGAVTTRTAFATFGGPDILARVTEVSSRALKAVRRQKYNIHRRCRPERLGAMITRAAHHKDDEWSPSEKQAYEYMHRQLLDCGLLDMVNEANERAGHAWSSNDGQLMLGENADWMEKGKNYLLPMAFPEGSPMHPSYGAGHATVAGACVTVVKAFFEMFSDGENNWNPLTMQDVTKNSDVFQANPTDRSLDVLRQVKASDLTILGELDKLAANISIGRNMAGVHFYSDYYDSVRMGERIAVQMLLDQMPAYGEAHSMRLLSFDGDQLELICKPVVDAEANFSGEFISELLVNGVATNAQNFRLKHLV